jgi:hypothetical protein
MRGRKYFQSHFIRPELPRYQKQTHYKKVNYRPVSLMNIHAKISTQYYQNEFNSTLKRS